jgi:hypothetical protein
MFSPDVTHPQGSTAELGSPCMVGWQAHVHAHGPRATWLAETPSHAVKYSATFLQRGVMLKPRNVSSSNNMKEEDEDEEGPHPLALVRDT